MKSKHVSSILVWIILLGATQQLVHGRRLQTVCSSDNDKANVSVRRRLCDKPASLASNPNSTRPVFREYIGGGHAGLKDVPVRNVTEVDFHFILAFAVDANGTGGAPTDGNFTAFWQPNLSPASVKAIKAAYPQGNVKVSLSVGGGVWPIFAPISVESWLDNAVSSLSDIISNYSLDGIDIDYELFEADATEAEFADCIGVLIKRLKENGIITVASIAPYPATDLYYEDLWSTYNGSIDLVNYQFYSEGSISAESYVAEYERVKGKYKGGRVLASFETVNSGTAIVPSSAIDACEQIKQSDGGLPGIFIWSADQSYDNFQFETKAQAILASP